MMTVIKRGDSPPILFLSNLEPPTAYFQKGPPARVIHFYAVKITSSVRPTLASTVSTRFPPLPVKMFFNDELHSGFDFFVRPPGSGTVRTPVAGLIGSKVLVFHGCGSPPFPKASARRLLD